MTSRRDRVRLVHDNPKGLAAIAHYPTFEHPSDRKLIVQDLGLTPYDRALTIQAEALREAAAGGVERLLVLEHPPVITLGRSSGAEHLRLAPDCMARLGIEVIQTSRGGSVTCHYPGQLVIYPVLRLSRRSGGLRRLVFDLEEAVIQTLAPYGLPVARHPGRPGVWVQERKIASIGLAVKHWVTYHGLSLNIGRDTSLFEMITPCGLTGVQVTSVHGELGREEPGVASVKAALIAVLLEGLASA